MLSRADRARAVLEAVLRGVALVALGVLLWRSLRPPAPSGVDVARGDVTAALARWTVTPPAVGHVVFDAVPTPATRDWVRALRRAGTAVRWSPSRPLDASAVVAEPAPVPYGATRVRLAAGGHAVSLRDAAGLIDTLPTGGTRTVELRTIAGSVRAVGPTFAAAVAPPHDSVTLRPVLVLGAAGWESKFTIAALEERGWRVASRVRVAPNVEVTQGPLGAIDTARYSAVIVLDTTAAPAAAAITRYARDGGGVILAGTAPRVAAFAAIVAGGVGRRVAGVAGAVASAEPRTGLGVFPVTSPRADAVALETRDAGVVVAARRVGAGRVLQSGYDETWRWRMAGGDAAASAHREWWTRLVGAVAYAPVMPQPTTADAALDDAPLASLVDALGAPAPLASGTARPTDGSMITRVLFALVLGALLLEWGSRRLRGAR